eukprot:4981367-Pleurochrysis_carterae.AAC.1
MEFGAGVCSGVQRMTRRLGPRALRSIKAGAAVLSSVHMRGWLGPRPLRSMVVGAAVRSGVQWMNFRLGPRPLHGRVRNRGRCERRLRRNRLGTRPPRRRLFFATHDARNATATSLPFFSLTKNPRQKRMMMSSKPACTWE